MVNPKYVKKNEQPMFENVSLGVIVRDELMNPAGGILPMLQRHIPYFPEVHVLDTGSVDGTRELLEHLSVVYPNLYVHDAVFEGYGPAREELGGHVKTRYVFVLDADELMDGRNLKKLIKTEEVGFLRDYDAVNISFRNVDRLGSTYYSHGWGNRLYNVNSTKFEGIVWERILVEGSVLERSDYYLFHFDPKNYIAKASEWYKNMSNHSDYLPDFSPSETKHFSEWKIPSRRALKKYGIDVFDIIKQIEDIGIKFPDKLRPKSPKSVKK